MVASAAHRRDVAIDLIGEAMPPSSSEAASGRLATIDQRISLKQNRRRKQSG
jgi:hypothetical protein